MNMDLGLGVRVIILRGEHAGRTGVTTDNTDKLAQLDALIQRNTTYGAKIRAQHEVPAGKIGVILDPDTCCVSLRSRDRREERVILDAGDVRSTAAHNMMGKIITTCLVSAFILCGAWFWHCRMHTPATPASVLHVGYP